MAADDEAMGCVIETLCIRACDDAAADADDDDDDVALCSQCQESVSSSGSEFPSSTDCRSSILSMSSHLSS